MKQRYLFLLAALIACLSAHAYSSGLTYNGIRYHTDDDQTTLYVAAKTPPYAGKVEIPDSVPFNGRMLPVKGVESNAFKGGSALTSVILPTTVTSIGAYAFSDCAALAEIIIPANVTSIGRYAFYRCSALNSVTLPPALKIIDRYAFAKCTSLEWLTIYTPDPAKISIGTKAFTLVDKTMCQLYVPQGSADLYRAAPEWGEFANIHTFVAPTSISLNKTDADIIGNNSEVLKVSFLPADTSEKFVMWSSSDKTVATVDDLGVVTGIKNGCSTITATTANGLKATCMVTVHGEPETIQLQPNNIQLKPGETMNLSALVGPETAHDKTVAWATSNPDIVTVDADGNITAVSIGRAEVSATTVNGLKAKCRVFVKKDWVPGTPLYIAYSCAGYNGLNPLTPIEMYHDPDAGTFSYTINRLHWFRLSWESSDFDAYGVFANLNKGEGSYPLSMDEHRAMQSPWISDWTITVADDLSTITISCTSRPDPIYVRWKSQDWEIREENRMGTWDGVKYNIDISPKIGDEFRLSGESWDDLCYGVNNPDEYLGYQIQLYPDGEYPVIVDEWFSWYVTWFEFDRSTGMLDFFVPINVEKVEGYAPKTRVEADRLVVDGLESGDIVTVVAPTGIVEAQLAADGSTVSARVGHGLHIVSINHHGTVHTSKIAVR